MIQYQYFHTGKEYIPKLSLPRGDENYGNFEKFFETLRTAICGEAFTYGILTGLNEYVMLQSSSSRESGLFVKGLRGDLSDIKVLPVKYVDKLEKRASVDDKNLSVLPEGTLPVLGRLSDSFAIAQNLHHIFPKLFDALVYGKEDKQIILIANSRDAALNYLKIISMLLPVSFMRKTGFSIGCSNVPDEPVSVINDRGETERISVRLWLPATGGGAGVYSDSCYVFDTVNNKDNYDKPLSIAAQTIDKINLANDLQSKNFAELIVQAFKEDGSVVSEKLDKLSAGFLFNISRNINSARYIVSLGYVNAEERSTLINALNYLLREGLSGAELSENDRQIIFAEYEKGGDVSEAIASSLFEYYCKYCDALNHAERGVFLKIMSEDNSGGRLNSFLQASLRRDFAAMVDAFSVAAAMLFEKMQADGYSVRSNSSLIQTLIRFTDIKGCYQRIPLEQRFGGEAFFDAVKDYEIEMRKILCAVLMASGYFSGVDAEFCQIRLKGLKKLVDNIPTGLARIEFLLGVRGRIIEISDEIPELGIDDNFDFIFNCEYGRHWMLDILNGLSVRDRLRADYYVRSHSAERRFYESMQDAVRQKLLDAEYVRKNIRSGTKERDEYVEFFFTLSEAQRGAYGEIEEYLNEQDREINISREFAEYRFGFAMECYDTLQETDKKKVEKDFTQSLKDVPASNRNDVVEKVIRVFGTVINTKKRGTKLFSSIGIWAFFLAFASFIILCIPAVVIPVSLGNSEWQQVYDKFLCYFLPEFLIVPPVVYLLDCIVYFCLREGNRVKRANIITFICGILPVMFFVAAYIIFYYIRLPLPFML